MEILNKKSILVQIFYPEILHRSALFPISLDFITQLESYLLNITQVRNLYCKAYILIEYKLYKPQFCNVLGFCL